MSSLHPYQRAGVDWLSTRRFAILADEPGLGKSAQLIQAAAKLDAFPALIVCPARLKTHWAREFSKWCPQIKPNSVSIVSYEYARDHAAKLLANGRYRVLIVDEAHALKEPTSQRTRALLGNNGLAHHADRLWCATGTPMLNHPGELWTLFYTMGVTALTHDAWVARYCVGYPTSHGFRITGGRAETRDELRQLMHQSGIMLARNRDDVGIELPWTDHQELTVEGPLDDEGIQFKLSLGDEEFATIRHRAMFEAKLLREEITKREFEALEALASSVSTLRWYTGLQKVKPVVEMVREELDSGQMEKVVIFAYHRVVVEAIAERLSAKPYCATRAYGGMSDTAFQRAIDKFTTDPACRVIVLNIQAGGVGQNLAAAHHVVMAEASWVPGENKQAADRCSRPPQTRPVTVRWIRLAGSIDDAVMGLLHRKAREISEVMAV